ncbi:MAG: class I SAM-dependent methyltransferase [Pseudomonadota bacterium]
MTFALQWLDLRAPADDAARDAALIAALADWAAQRTGGEPLRIVDLGAGAGATHRALAAHLPGAHWTLVDHDPALLAEAARRTGAQTRQADLSRDLEDVLAGADLVAASAFFDLVSAAWLDRFAAALPPGAAVHAALTYDGRETWTPAPPDDGEAQDAFRAHMRRDKGFGPALGGDAPAALAAALGGARRVTAAPSPWILTEKDRALIEALSDGAAQAVAETGALTDARLSGWHAARRMAARAEIGHCDLLALPPADA